MAKQGFTMGDTVPGLIIDNVEDTPYVTGMLSFEELKGISLLVPFLNNTPQFAAVRGWVREGRPPSNLQLLTGTGRFTLYGCRTSGSSLNFGGQGFSTVRVTPQEVVFKDRDGDFEDALEVTELRSQLDGLTEWTSMGATSYSVVADEKNRAQKISVEVESPPALTWSLGDVTFELSTDWRTDQEEPGFRVREWVCLTTKYATSRPCADHLAEQRKIVALLTLMYGQPVAFRRHEIRDSRFNAKVLTGKVVHVPFFEMVSENTVSDYWRPLPGKLKHPLATASEVGIEGLQRWLAEFEEWERLIQPGAGTLRRPESYVEDHIVNASVSLEAAGHILGEVEGERDSWSKGKRPQPTTATYVFRSLSTVNLDWSDIAESPMALARAVANNYNDVKHANRGPMPPADHTYVAGKVALLVVRLLALRLMEPSMTLTKAFGEDWKFGTFKQQIIDMNVYAYAGGKFGPQPQEESEREEA
ncbi:hypothetical protein ACU18_13960 [Arthrobacter sp. ZBG10]|uniref:ApeA N-terminal domain 1-containing protein n=1 Tax=Arthrobacter sp. ZBG10 TaxID=1676590 RepID=UPI00067FB953|nr:hypothetical protein [Arthrobacter sp. ZBG10]KNH16262.1 hypothetical protein ACU18_13960 [Arthrobacter sp. ZBG10]